MLTVKARHVAAILSIIAGPAMAQSVTASGGTPAGVPTPGRTQSHAFSTSQTARNRNQAPAFHLFGAPVVIQAPVDAPYDAAAFSTYEGQPGQGPNALLAASNGGQP